MKKVMGLLLALTTLSLASQQLVHAGSVSTSFPVTVSVSEAWTVAATGFAFPAYSGVGVDSTSTIDITCASNLPYQITLNGGNNFNSGTGHRRMASGATFLEYQLYQQNGFQTVWGDSGFQGTMPNGTPKAGTGTGASQQHTVFGHLYANQVVPGGTYTDTVLVTVNF